jgi:hypothetical protein
MWGGITASTSPGGNITGLTSIAERNGAYFVERILNGASPADLLVERPNLKTAVALGLTIAPSLLLRADPVIE